jgi:hypothetical protein
MTICLLASSLTQTKLFSMKEMEQRWAKELPRTQDLTQQNAIILSKCPMRALNMENKLARFDKQNKIQCPAKLSSLF